MAEYKISVYERNEQAKENIKQWKGRLRGGETELLKMKDKNTEVKKKGVKLQISYKWRELIKWKTDLYKALRMQQEV